MEKFIREILDTPWWLVLAIAIYSVSWSVYKDLFEEGRANTRWVDDLEQDSWAKWYRTMVNRMLDWVDTRLTPDIPRKRWPGEGLQVAFSSGLFGLCLVLALFYPGLTVIGQWGVLNTEGRIADLLLIDDGATRFERYGILGLLASSIAANFGAMRARGRIRWALLVLVNGFLLAFAVSSVFVASGAFAASGASAVEYAFAVAAAMVVGVAVAVAFAINLAFALVVAGAFGFAAATVAVAVTVFAGAIGFAAAAVAALAFTGVIIQIWLGRRLGREALAQGISLILIPLVFGVGLEFFPFQPDTRDQKLAAVLFIVLLPLMNGFADFLSVGATRYTLRRGARDDATTWAWMLADIGIGFAIFLALGCLILLYIQVFQLPTGPMIDARALLADVRAQPLHYWWLYIMLFSTMLPTALHLAVASFGSVLKVSPWLRAHIAEGLKAGAAGDKVRGRWAVQWLCLSMTLTVMVPIFLVGSLWVNAGAIGIALLDFFGWVQDGVERVPKFEKEWIVGWVS